MDINELKNELVKVEDEIKKMIEDAEKEGVKLTEELQIIFDGLINKKTNLTEQIEKEESQYSDDVDTDEPQLKEKEERNNMNILELIKKNGNPTTEMIEANKRNLANFNQSVGDHSNHGIILNTRALVGADQVGKGSELLGTTTAPTVSPLYIDSLMDKLGVKFIEGIQNEYVIPVFEGKTGENAGIAAEWLAEGDSVSEGSATSKQLSLKPLRLSSYLTISEKLMLQPNGQAQKFIEESVFQAVRTTLQATLFGKNAGEAGKKPAGLLYNGGAAPTLGGDVDFSTVVLMEAALSQNHFDPTKLKYATNFRGGAKLKTTTKEANNAGFLMEDGRMNGYEVVQSNFIPMVDATDEYFIMGSFDDIHVVQFGDGIKIDVEYNAKKAVYEIVATGYFNFVNTRSNSIALGKITR